jgi:hypothetical protein
MRINNNKLERIMILKKSILGSMITLALVSNSTSFASTHEVSGDISKFTSDKTTTQKKKGSAGYIIQLKAQPGISKAQELGELLPSNQVVGIAGNNYNSATPAMQAYTNALEKKQKEVAGQLGSITIQHSYKHTFNGFSAQLTPKQKSVLESHPDVLGIWEDKLEKITTSNTPEFLGLTGSGGQHNSDIKGEGIIIGVLDTGIQPDNASFADDGSYSDPADLGWTGICDTGDDEDFTCSNKLIGARYYNSSFASQNEIRYDLGEINSPRDSDGHGSHTSSTAGGNEGVQVDLNGYDAGLISGMAPRARIAMYKTCWNSTLEGASGCFYGDNMAAIDQAVIDGVDVINYSIGGSLTDLTTPTAAAMLRATQAGVFVSVSAGNSGPEAETVGTPAPWVTSVAASTYNGTSAMVGEALEITSGSLSPTSLLSIPASFAPTANGASGELVLAEPITACNSEPLTNSQELAGKVALIARGACAFTEKFLNAQNAGATAVVVYTTEGTNPFIMGAENPPEILIPGVMVSFSNGQDLTASISEDSTSVLFTDNAVTGEAIEVGNVMAAFSSRGPNKASYDIIKPDITAPGVKILAANASTPMLTEHGQSFKYLQGTSMSSPHIAGIAALFKQSHSDWSPAQIKSALMTNAYQDVKKEDGITPADAFDFGAGHVNPVGSLEPGLLYDANSNDYLAFLCGIGNESFVESYETNCETLAANGFSTDPSQLNIASIGVAELLADETVSRTVTNATDVASVYTATIEAPEGINVTLATFNSEGNPIPDNVLTVDANGTASYALTFSKTEATETDVWKFGSIIWTDGAGHIVRSPIAIKAIADVNIEVPESISGNLQRGRYRFPVKMLYSGNTSIDYAGLVAPFGSSRTVSQDADQTFSFSEPGMGTHIFEIPEGTKVLRLSLIDSLIGDGSGGTDLDLYVYRCTGWRCTEVATSLNGGSNEDVILTNPEPAASYDAGNVYLVWVHGYDTALPDVDGAPTPLNYTMLGWVADRAETSTRVRSSSRAIKGRYNYTSIMTRGLTPGMLYMGAVTFYNADGEAEGTTVLELANP